MLVMLNTLMDISEAESGAMQLQREPVRLARVVARAVELYRDVAEAKGVTLEVRLKPDHDGRLKPDIDAHRRRGIRLQPDRR